MKVAIYCRISQDNTGEGLGVSRQLEDCAALAEQLGWEVVEVYTDNDISAMSSKPRPAYRRMLADCDAGHIEGIVAWHADRMYRKATDLGELVDVCKRNNVQIATVKAGTIDLTTPTGRLVAGLLAQVATYEGEAKSDRWKRSIRQRREAGAAPFSRSRLFGYERDTAINEPEAEHVRWMAAEILDGRSMNSLARELNERGILTTEGNTWSTQSLRRLLLNPRIAGFATLGRREERVNSKGERVGRRVIDIVGKGQWKPILDDATWEGVRATLTARADTRPTPPRVALLPGLVYCHCGARMVTGSRMTKRKGVLSRTYRCDHTPGAKGCGKLSVQAEPVEEVVEALARKLLADPSVRARLDGLRSEPGPKRHEVAELELRIAELKRQLDEPGTPVATLLRAIDRAKERQEALLRELGAVAHPSIPADIASWPSDLRRRRALVDLVVERVHIMPSETPGLFDPKRVVVDPR
ncbi:DNA invertase Pin-like site-specific DNA recombinase [Nocardioides ginsengisegetis]|uniref:DNA invertase Pin-like site-specific DNA recombinase n=1 Tax=Nocardioides ginsengisegetis TaxID=661491 RepID=A0A7W3P7S3_9ACTN|nr:DNA invertase Pin-like site-specific DNA recombinase [Nocardioides ginsengisegetis]MBA8805570.1 DNA invertase Pin-like site-specific DNA recombinase [Nocardioides ginsengisegetis]